MVNGIKVNPDVRHKQLLEQTHKWVGQTFYGTMLKQMRNSPFKSELFGGGRGGEMFGQMLDQHLAERMSKNAGGKLATSIVRKIERGMGASGARQRGVEALRQQGKIGQGIDVRR